jgi:SAM-dependent methyltransferase
MGGWRGQQILFLGAGFCRGDRNLQGEPPMTESIQAKEWADFHRDRVETNYPKWPSEVMLKLLFGSYLKNAVRPEKGWCVLDVGCGFGNNLRPFLELGCDCHGVEIDPGIPPMTEHLLKEMGHNASIKTGTNRSLPYADDTFDLVLSINTLHYEGSEENVLAALSEFRRVMKPGGSLYLSTVGPNHDIQTRARTLGNHQYLIQGWDFRDGQTFFFLDNESYLEFYCSKFFDCVETVTLTERLVSIVNENLISLCR